jgi:hypothetical protein
MTMEEEDNSLIDNLQSRLLELKPLSHLYRKNMGKEDYTIFYEIDRLGKILQKIKTRCLNYSHMKIVPDRLLLINSSNDSINFMTDFTYSRSGEDKRIKF